MPRLHSKTQPRTMDNGGVKFAAPVYHDGDSKHEPTFCVEDVCSDTEYMHLRCSCPPFLMSAPGHAPWCQHVRETVVKQLDRPYMEWVTGHSSIPADPGDCYVSVTIFEMPETIACIALSPAPDIADMTLEASLLRPDDSRIRLGYTSPRATRLGLRAMFLEWLVEFSDKDQTCTSDLHDPDTRTMSIKISSKRDMANLASILLDGWCYECVRNWMAPEL